MANSSSLLASEDDLATPLLSTTDPLLSEEEESELAQIIRRSVETRDQLPPALPTTTISETGDARTTPFEEPRLRLSTPVATPPIASSAEVSLIVVTAATLTILQCGWVWTSYLSSSWSDTHLRVELSWQHDYLPSLDDFTDTLIRSMDLGGLLSMLNTAQMYGLLAVVGVTAVVLPCLAMCSHPMWIVEYYSSYYSNKQSQTLFVRPLLAWLLRFSFIAVYMLLLLDLTASRIALEWTDTTISVRNRMQGGLVAYLLGISAALLVIATMRSAISSHDNCDSESAGHMQANRPSEGSGPPPQSAFRYPWTGEITYSPIASERDVEPFQTGPALPQQDSRRRLRYLPQSHRDIGWGRRLLVWESGLLTAVLLVSSLTLPLFELRYNGLASEFMSGTIVLVYLWKIPWLLWTHGLAAGTDEWMLVISVGGFVIFVFALPVIVFLCAIAVWMGSANASRQYRSWVHCLAPMATCIVFALTVLLTMPSLGPIMDSVLQESSSGLCQKFKRFMGESCLVVFGKVLPGTWSMLGQAMALEVFATLTLKYVAHY